MTDYFITVVSQNPMQPEPIRGVRTIGKSEDYAEGVMAGLKIAYPDNEVYKEEIKN